ncbi:hypothetical protein AGMMS50222_07940 [Endomicrobiia bacterium]|nr:hypothetical protein AGMMS50222_07940 [Endomicrobiia bacterium]
MRKCGVLVVVVVVLSSLVFSSVEARSDGVLSELLSEKASIESKIESHESRFDTYFDFHNLYAIAQLIKHINQFQRRHAGIVHNIEFLNMVFIDD